MAKKKKRPGLYLSPALAAVLAVALMGVSFGAGWFFGVRSTQFHGDILLVNESHRLAADYVPEGLEESYRACIF